MTGNNHFHHQHHAYQDDTIKNFHNRHRLTTSIVPSRIHDLKYWKQFTINAHSSVLAGTSCSPLIHSSTKTSKASPINTGPLKDHSLQFIQREHQSIQLTKSREPLSEIDHQTDTMAPKQTRASTKTKELQAVDTPLVQRLKNIKNSKV